MTTKQAKAAYRKAKAPRMTEKGYRQFKRGCELDDRAQRIMDKEKRKKENRLKRMEKEEKERERRRKAGLPEKPEGYLSPRQCRLGMFFGKEAQAQSSRGNTLDRDEEDGDQDEAREYTPETEEVDLKEAEMVDSNTEEFQVGEPYLPPSTPKDRGTEGKVLQELSPNRPTQRYHKGLLSPRVDTCRVQPQEDFDGLDDSEMEDFWMKAPKMSEPNPPALTPKHDVPEGKAPQEPSLNRPSQTHRRAERLSQIDQSGAISPEVIDWLALLPSNTQIQRELSVSPSKFKTPATPVPKSLAPSRNSAAVVTPANIEAMTAVSVCPDDVNAIMAFMSTQDLVFTSEEMEELTTPTHSKGSLKEMFDFEEFGVCTQDFLELED